MHSWAGRREEFEKRGACALLWALSVHDKASGDAPFLGGLALIERAASDDRHFVRKAVDMALRAVGKRNAALNAAAVDVARRLAASADRTSQWVGRHALRELATKRFRYLKIVTLAIWENREAFDAARRLVQARYQEEGFDPRELIARLGIEADLGAYHPLGGA